MNAHMNPTVAEVIGAIDQYFDTTPRQKIYEDLVEAGLDFYRDLTVVNPVDMMIGSEHSIACQETLNFLAVSSIRSNEDILKELELAYGWKSFNCEPLEMSAIEYGLAA